MELTEKSVVLSSEFFERPTLTVAKDLLGKFLVRRFADREMAAMITEVEAYVGPEDKASHASRGRTPRTEVMFGGPGYWYVYLIYGMHHCLNVVTEQKGYPAAVLIRGVDAIEGPGRVCKRFGIDKWFNTRLAVPDTGLWIENREMKIKPSQIRQGPRIGVEYAEEWKTKPWRFYIEDVQI